MKKNDNNKVLKNLALITQVGLSMITPILLGLFIGQKIDRWIGTENIFAIIFILLGVGAAFMNLFKISGVWKNKRK